MEKKRLLVAVGVVVALFSLAFLAAACNDDEDNGNGQVTPVASETPGESDMTPSDGDMTPADGAVETPEDEANGTPEEGALRDGGPAWLVEEGPAAAALV